MKKICIMLISMLTIISCGTQKISYSLNPLNIKSYTDTETEFRDWGFSDNPDNSIKRNEATAEALSRLSLKINSQITTGFEKYVKSIKIGKEIEIQNIIETYEQITSHNNLHGWSVVEEVKKGKDYYIAISIDRNILFNERTNKIIELLPQELKEQLILDKINFIKHLKE